MKNNFILFCLVIIVLLSTQCKKNETSLIQKNQNYTAFTNDSIYGVIHNACLDELTNYINFPCIDTINIADYLKDFLYNNYDIIIDTGMQIDSINYSDFKDFGIHLYNESIVSDKVVEYFDGLDSIKDYSTTQTIFDSVITNLVNTIYDDKDLHSYEIHLLASTILFYRSSVKYWFDATNSVSSSWHMEMSYFPNFEDYALAKRPFYVADFAFADAIGFSRQYALCAYEYCPDFKKPYKGTNCPSLCAKEAIIYGLYASVGGLF